MGLEPDYKSRYPNIQFYKFKKNEIKFDFYQMYTFIIVDLKYKKIKIQ